LSSLRRLCHADRGQRTELVLVLADHRAERVTEALNEIYSQVEAKLDPVLHEFQARSLDPEEW
jgi:hypothetical protein